jgi:hypothetical protein
MRLLRNHSMAIIKKSDCRQLTYPKTSISDRLDGGLAFETRSTIASFILGGLCVEF